MTETEVVALISAGAALLAAAITGGVTYFVTSRQVRSAAALARDQRVQGRRAEAYLQLFEHVGRLNTWILFVMAIDQRGTDAVNGPEPTLIGEERWYPMISLCRAFGSRDVLTTFTKLHLAAQSVSSSLKRHPPPPTPAEAQSAAYRDHVESKRRRDLCWDCTVLVYTVQPMMANELQGENHPLPSFADVRANVAEEETLREAARTSNFFGDS
jgi:hypothetical protein